MPINKYNITPTDFGAIQKSFPENTPPRCISVVGAGGKSHLIYWLALLFKQQGLSVCITTTTKMYYPNDLNVDNIIELGTLSKTALADYRFNTTPTTSSGNISFLYKSRISKTDNGKEKVQGLTTDEITKLTSLCRFDLFIIEADGAKHLPIKAPAGHEPCIYKSSDMVIGVTGADAIFVKAQAEQIHRWAHFSELTNCNPGDKIDYPILKQLLANPVGMFKNSPDKATKIWLINKVDRCVDLPRLMQLAERLYGDIPELHSVWLTQLNSTHPLVHIIHD